MRRPVAGGGGPGFALIELMVVASLLAVVLAALLAFLDTGSKLSPTYQERGLVVRDAQVALERMTRELRQASTLQLGAQWVEFDMVVREGQPGSAEDGDGEEDGDGAEGCVGEGEEEDGEEDEPSGGGPACTVRVLYDCRYGADGELRTDPPFQCRRFEGSLQRPPELPCDTDVTPTGALASGVQNAAIFTRASSYVEIRLELKSEDFREPADSPDPPRVVFRDGVELRNLGLTPGC